MTTAKQKSVRLKVSRIKPSKSGNVRYLMRVRKTNKPYEMIEAPKKHRRAIKRMVRQRTGRGVRINPRRSLTQAEMLRSKLRYIEIQIKSPRGGNWFMSAQFDDTEKGLTSAKTRAAEISKMLIPGAKVRVVRK